MNDTLFAQIRSASCTEWLAGLKRETALPEWCSALPRLPEEAFQKRFVGKANGPAMQVAYEAVEIFRQGTAALGSEFNANNVILDFGCGWGRISQALYRYFRPSNIYSADIQLDAIEFCRSSGLATHITQVDNTALIDLPQHSIDHVVAFSVFSHLSEALANLWMREFYRILKPGGSVAITTRHTSMLRHVSNLKQLPAHDIPVHALGLIEAYGDIDTAFEQYKQGKYVYRAYPHVTKSGDGYGEAIVPEQYVRNVWQPLFGGACSFAPPTTVVDQATIFLTKRR